MVPPQESAFQTANGPSPKYPLLNRANGGGQEAPARTRDAEVVLDGDSDSSADEGGQYLYDDMPEGAESVIGVSIGRVRTRLTPSLTTTTERVATFESVRGVRQFGDSDEVEKATAGSIAQEELRGLPQEKHSPKETQRSNVSKNVLQNLPTSTRPRSSSGPVGSGGKRFLPFSLPSMPKSPSLSSFNFPSLNSPLPFLSAQKGSSINDASRVKARKPKAFSNDSTTPVVLTE